MLTTTEILKKVRELEIKSKKLTRHLFTGEYHSAFKGRGMSFKEVREYHAGDDPRFIDWNVSARFNHPFSKVFEEERELSVMLIVDLSASSFFGTRSTRQKDLITEIGAVIAFSAVSNNDKVGVLFFSDRVEMFIPPKKGRDHALFIVREMLTLEPKGKGTNIAEALRKFTNSIKQGCISFLLSDFMDANYEDALKVAGKKHDLIGVRVYDPMLMALPDIGLLEVEDSESGQVAVIDTSDYLVRKSYQEEFTRFNEYSRSVFSKAGSDLMHIRTDEDYVKTLQKFFISRK